MRPGGSQNLLLSIRQQGAEATVTVDAVLPDGTFLNSADVSLKASDPALQQTQLPLRQTAPGRYETTIPLPQTGIWNLEATVNQPGQAPMRTTRSLYAGISSEFRLRPVNENLLQQLASVSSGRWNPDPADVFGKSARTASRSMPLRTWLLSAAAVLLLLDVALRRLEIRPKMTP